MKRLTWRLRMAGGLLGWQGWVGLFLISVSIIQAAVIVPGRLGDLQRAESEVETLRNRLKLKGPNAGNRVASREDQLANFHAFFPASTTLPDWLEKIYEAAERSGVRIDAGEYKMLQDRSWKLDRYQVTLPVRGNYVQVRQFMAAILADIPVASMDEVGFRRDAVGSAAVDARIKLTVYLRRQS
jgi:Tfp pilus assembly protein PilO